MYQPYPGSDTQLPELHHPPAPPSVLRGLVWLVALTAVVFLWRRSSTVYFKGTPS